MDLVIKSFNIFGLNVTFYGLTIAFGMVVAILAVCSICKLRGFKSDDIFLLALYAIPLAIIGARIYYVVFSDHSYTFWEVFQIWNGGMAIYGGVIGGAFGAMLYCLIHKKNFLAIADLGATGLILGQAIGRWGNFFNQEAYGNEVTNAAMQWFPFAVYIEEKGAWFLATFFYEFLWNLAVFAILFILIRKLSKNGAIMSLYFILYGIGRMFIEGLRTDSLYIGTTGIRVSQLLSGILIVFGIIMLIVIYTKHKRDKIEKNTNHSSV